MRRLRALFIRLASLFRTRGREQDMAEELAGHLEMHIDDNLRAGMTPEEARRQALIRLGGLEQARESYRDRRGLPFLETFLQDLRYGIRTLAKDPRFTVVTVVTLALGIAANATIFSAINGWMLRPPRIKDPARVVAILTTDPARGAYGWDQKPVSAADFVAWRDQSQSFESMVASEFGDFALTGDGEPERLLGRRVSAEYFHLLGVDAALGRTFLPGEDQPGHPQVVILSHRLWERRFGSDAKVVGQTLRLNGESYTVAGIMPRRFRVDFYDEQLWVPLVLAPERLTPVARADRSLSVLARLKPGVDARTASAEVATLARRADHIYPGTTQGWGARAMVLQKYIADEFKLGMGIQMGAVLLVLLVACANIASLQLTRAAGRQTEMAVRMALGASRFRLVRQLLVESLVLALVGGGLGLLLAWWGVAGFRSGLNSTDYVSAMALEITIDFNVLVFTLAIAVLAALLFGVAPAFHQTAVNLQLSLKEGGRTISQGRARRRAYSALVTAQIALALALMVGAGLMIRGIAYKAYGGFGIDPKQVLTAQVRLTEGRYEDPSAQAAFFREAIERLEALPGVVSAGAATSLAIDESRVVTFSVEGQPVLPRTERARTEHFAISPRFLDTLRVPLLRGRGLDPHDDVKASPVALVNEAFARRYFPNDDPLGKHLRPDTGTEDRTDWSEIVGVVGDVADLSEEWEQRPQVYESCLQRPSATMILAVRTTSAPAAFGPLLRRAIWSIDKDQPVNRVLTMEQVIADNRANGVLAMTLFGSFAGLALVMAMVGVFGVVAYTVEQRTHEIGIRIALGARKGDVMGMVMSKGLVLGAMGVGIGLVLAAPLVWLPTGMAPGMPVDQRVSVVIAAAVVIWLVALLASYIPARRATTVDPTVALRYE